MAQVLSNSAIRRFGSSQRMHWMAAGVAALAMVAGSVQAADQAPSRTVRYEDLNLMRNADAGILYARLRAAAAQVCSEFDGKQLKQMALQRDCYRTALTDAVAKVDNGTLTALHESGSTIRLAQRAAKHQRRS